MFEKLGQTMNVLKNLQKLMNKDYFITGIFGGLAGTIVMDLYNTVSKKLGMTEALYGQIAGSLIMQPIKTKRTKNFVIGQITHTVTGAWLGLPLAYLLKITGKNYHLMKGALWGSFSWLMVFNFSRRFKILTFNPHLARTHYSQFLSNIPYGMVTAQAMVSMSPELFPDAVSYDKATFNVESKDKGMSRKPQVEGYQEIGEYEDIEKNWQDSVFH